jgi:hypothetical protein
MAIEDFGKTPVDSADRSGKFECISLTLRNFEAKLDGLRLLTTFPTETAITESERGQEIHKIFGLCEWLQAEGKVQASRCGMKSQSAAPRSLLDYCGNFPIIRIRDFACLRCEKAAKILEIYGDAI